MNSINCNINFESSGPPIYSKNVIHVIRSTSILVTVVYTILGLLQTAL
jgi:hypothetical protein